MVVGIEEMYCPRCKKVTDHAIVQGGEFRKTWQRIICAICQFTLYDEVKAPGEP